MSLYFTSAKEFSVSVSVLILTISFGEIKGKNVQIYTDKNETPKFQTNIYHILFGLNLYKPEASYNNGTSCQIQFSIFPLFLLNKRRMSP